MTLRSVPAALLLAGLASMPAQSAARHAHEHGVTHLDIVIEGGHVALNLQAAGHHIVGFEHAPETDAQRAAYAAAEATLGDAAALFAPDVEAGCRVVVAKAIAPGAATGDDGHAHGHAHAHDSDWRGEYRFECASPERLRGIGHALFRAFPGTEEVRWQLLAPAGQDGGVLRAGQDRIAVPRSR